MTLRALFEKLKNAAGRYEASHNFTCDVCGREVFQNERICDDCRKHLPWNLAPVCPLCGRKVGEEGLCLDCKRKPLVVKRARSCFLHEGDAARLVVRFKRGQKYLFRTLCDFLHPLAAKEFPEADAVTFVPMTAKAERARGYNQSRLLAEELGRRMGLELLAPTVKQRETKAQKFLGREERAENLKGCFHVRERKLVRQRRILLVDDTLTTGATSDELASALLRAGAAAVYLITVTSVPKKHPFGKKDEILPSSAPL